MPSALHRLARLVRPSPLSVVYHERYAVTIPGVPLDPDRASRILAFLLDGRFVHRRAVVRPEPAPVRDLLRAHDAGYLHTLEDPATVSAIVGAQLTAPEAATACRAFSIRFRMARSRRRRSPRMGGTGVVSMVHGSGHAASPRLRVAAADPGANPNVLLPIGEGSFEPLSSQAHMTGIPVRVRAVVPG